MDIRKIACLSALLIITGLARAFTGGDGTPQAPYQISTRADLEAVNSDLAASYILINDIDLTGIDCTKSIIAAFEDDDEILHPFTGSFDGNGFKIINMNINSIPTFCIGLFGIVESSGIVKNLVIENCTITGSGYIGALIGINYGTIENCSTSGIIAGLPRSGDVGGLVGHNDKGTIRGCHATVEVTGRQYSGGLIGSNFEGTVTNCFAEGNVSGLEEIGGLIGYNVRGVITDCYSNGSVIGEDYVGGLVGTNFGSITNCYATGAVSSSDASGISLYFGGLVGYSDNTILNCHAAGNVTGGRSAGGLVGSSPSGTILNCYATGNVTGYSSIGGLVGFATGSAIGGIVANCYATGNVSGENLYIGGLIGSNSNIYPTSNCYAVGNVSGIDYVGGLIGNNHGPTENCYAIGQVSGSGEYVCGFVGSNSYWGAISDCFWNSETSGQIIGCKSNDLYLDSIVNLTGKTTAQMQDIGTFLEAGWDFKGEEANGISEVWQMGTDGYPELYLFSNTYSPQQLAGDGTKQTPYLIYTKYDLRAVSQDINAHYLLMANIDLTGTTFNTAVVSHFGGLLDGNGLSIRNLRIETEAAFFTALFGTIASNGIVNNLTIENCNITANLRASALVANNFGTIKNCRISGYIDGTNEIGGLAGGNMGKITNCRSSAIINGLDSIGNIVGSNSGEIRNCFAAGTTTGSNATGGLVGYNTTNGEIIDCYTYSNINGIVSSGGLVGSNDSIITNCYALGNVNDLDKTGGLVGDVYRGTVTNSFWNTDVTGQIPGYNLESGFIGTITNVAGKTTAEMRNINTFLSTGWDFLGEAANGGEEVWAMPDGGYPVLAWIADFNADGRIDYADYDMLSSQWLQSGTELICDIYPSGIGDGIVNVDDLLMFADMWQQEIRSQEFSGDFNYDYAVDTSDMFYIIDEWLGTGIKCDIAPANGDGEVNIIDFSTMAHHWLITYPYLSE